MTDSIPSDNRFKYDVAISLRAADAQLAERIRAALEPSLRVFVFTQRQQEIAGKSLVETFSEVFKRDARLTVILHRAGWGETEYTDLEALAIQSRGLKTRWRSPVLIALDDTPVPLWFPDVYGFLEFERYGFEEAVGVIRARAEELGALTRPLSPAERTAKRFAAHEAAQERRERMQSALAVSEAEGEVGRLFAFLESQVAEINEQSPELGMRVGGHRPPGPSEPVLGVRTSRCSTDVRWKSASNSIRVSSLLVASAGQQLPLPGEPGGVVTGGNMVVNHEAYVPFLTASGWQWQEAPAVVGRRDVDIFEVHKTDAPILFSDTLAERIVLAHLDRHFVEMQSPSPRYV